MLDSAEVFNPVANGLRRGSGEARGADGSQDVLDIVLTPELNDGEPKDDFGRGLLGSSKEDGPLMNEGSLADDAPPANTKRCVMVHARRRGKRHHRRR